MTTCNKISDDLKINSLVRHEVERLPPYGAGQTLNQAQRAWPDVDMVNLSVNENPFGISGGAQQAVADTLTASACYPDSQCRDLRQALAEKLDFAYECIVTGNGSEDILSLLCKAFIKPGDPVMVAKPTFSLHPIYANMMGANVIAVPMSADMQYDVDTWVSQIAKIPELKVLMLANPSNPVGCTLSHQGLMACIDACPQDTLIVIDEAYFEFAEGAQDFADSLAILQAQSRPWIVLRTFSKAYGLAGLRVGYGLVSNSKIIDYLDRVRTPYNVNSVAQNAAIAVLADAGYLDKTVSLVQKESVRVTAALENLGLFVAPSRANFLFIDCKRDSGMVAEQLLAKGIMVKPWREAGYENYIRMTLGLEQQNERFIGALAEIITADSPCI